MNQIWPKFLALLSLATLFVWLVVGRLPDDNLHLVFCNVGQGDATLITYKSTQILVDGGPDKKVLDCLAKFMPVWDKQIELVYLTHPEADHATGLVDVIRRYQVSTFLATPLDNSTATIKALEQALKDRQVQVQFINSDFDLRQGLISLDTVWPTPQYLSETHSDENCLAQTQTGTKILGCSTATHGFNYYSLVLHLKFGDFDALLPGDADSHIQDKLLQTGEISPMEVLKFPHHGSKTGATDQFLQSLHPDLVVISVGKNSYGHPTPETLAQIMSKGIKLVRTDESGDIQLVTNGHTWWQQK